MFWIIVTGAVLIGGIIGGELGRQGRAVTIADVDAEHVRAIRERDHSLQRPATESDRPRIRALFH